MSNPVFPVGKVLSVITFVARETSFAVGTFAGCHKGQTLTAVVMKTATKKWVVKIINDDGLDVAEIANRSWDYKMARTKALRLASEI